MSGIKAKISSRNFAPLVPCPKFKLNKFTQKTNIFQRQRHIQVACAFFMLALSISAFKTFSPALVTLIQHSRLVGVKKPAVARRLTK
jgi:hypothetical protein